MISGVCACFGGHAVSSILEHKALENSSHPQLAAVAMENGRIWRGAADLDSIRKDGSQDREVHIEEMAPAGPSPAQWIPW